MAKARQSVTPLHDLVRQEYWPYDRPKTSATLPTQQASCGYQFFLIGPTASLNGPFLTTKKCGKSRILSDAEGPVKEIWCPQDARRVGSVADVFGGSYHGYS